MGLKPQAPRAGTPGTITRGYKFRLYPNKAHRTYISQNEGCTRYVFNMLLEWFKVNYEIYEALVKSYPDFPKPLVNKVTINEQLAFLKECTVDEQGDKWLKEAGSTPVQQASYQFLDAAKRFMSGTTEYPKFKAKRYSQSLTYTYQAFEVIGSKIKLQKLDEPISFKKHRELPSAPSNATITKESDGKYYVAFTCTFVPTPRKHGTKVLGIDLGITKLATLSDGTELENPKHYEKSLAKLTKAQAKLSKLPKGSKSYNCQRIRVARHHAYVANQRKNNLHQVTSKLVSESQALVVENLDIDSMFNKGRKFTRRLMDASFGMFKRFLSQKTRETEGCQLFIADIYYPSTQMCSSCKHIPSEKIELAVRSWTCPACGTSHERDLNAATNLVHLAEAAMNSPYYNPTKRIYYTNQHGALIT